MYFLEKSPNFKCNVQAFQASQSDGTSTVRKLLISCFFEAQIRRLSGNHASFGCDKSLESNWVHLCHCAIYALLCHIPVHRVSKLIWLISRYDQNRSLACMLHFAWESYHFTSTLVSEHQILKLYQCVRVLKTDFSKTPYRSRRPTIERAKAQTEEAFVSSQLFAIQSTCILWAAWLSAHKRLHTFLLRHNSPV